MLDIAERVLPEPHISAALPIRMDAADDDELEALSDMLLAALVAVAARSKRRQADVGAALARAGMEAPPELVKEALARLQAQARIRDVVPLYDGGLLATLTNTGLDLSGSSREWHFLQRLE